MPLYEYECRKCHHRFEEIQKVSDRPVTRCPKCRTGRVQKLISAPAVHVKGTGWYVTDYAGKGKADKAEKGDTADTGGKADKADTADKSGKPAKKKSPGKD